MTTFTHQLLSRKTSTPEVWQCDRCVVVPERGGTLFRQIFLSRNGAPVNTVYHSRNADTAAFRQISSYYKKVTLYTKFGKLVLRKSLKLVPPDVIF